MLIIMLDVLVACEESQVVASAFRSLGHKAFSCDLVFPSGRRLDWHIQGDCLQFLNGFCDFRTLDGSYHILDKSWDLLICHPPCTYLSACGAAYMYPHSGVVDEVRLSKALAAKEFFLSCLNAECNYIAVENPRPLKIVGLPSPSDCVQPYDFGDPFSKRTYLWLKNLPPLFPTLCLSDYVPWICSNTGGKKRGQKFSKGAASSSRLKSRSFPGIAAAMAFQWSSFVEGELSEGDTPFMFISPSDTKNLISLLKI